MECINVNCDGVGVMKHQRVKENGIYYNQYYIECVKCQKDWVTKKTETMTNNAFKSAKKRNVRV